MHVSEAGGYEPIVGTLPDMHRTPLLSIATFHTPRARRVLRVGSCAPVKHQNPVISSLGIMPVQSHGSLLSSSPVNRSVLPAKRHLEADNIQRLGALGQPSCA